MTLLDQVLISKPFASSIRLIKQRCCFASIQPRSSSVPLLLKHSQPCLLLHPSWPWRKVLDYGVEYFCPWPRPPKRLVWPMLALPFTRAWKLWQLKQFFLWGLRRSCRQKSFPRRTKKKQMPQMSWSRSPPMPWYQECLTYFLAWAPLPRFRYVSRVKYEPNSRSNSIFFLFFSVVLLHNLLQNDARWNWIVWICCDGSQSQRIHLGRIWIKFHSVVLQWSAHCFPTYYRKVWRLWSFQVLGFESPVTTSLCCSSHR